MKTEREEKVYPFYNNFRVLIKCWQTAILLCILGHRWQKFKIPWLNTTQNRHLFLPFNIYYKSYLELCNLVPTWILSRTNNAVNVKYRFHNDQDLISNYLSNFNMIIFMFKLNNVK